MLKATINHAQFNALDALSWWKANDSYIRERFGNNDPELQKIHASIMSLFDELDALRVPMWLQNVALSFGNDWRLQKARYLSSWLESLPGYEIVIDWRA